MRRSASTFPSSRERSTSCCRRPISYLEIVVSYVGAAATKSIILGLIILATAGLFVPLRIAHPFWMMLFLVLTAVTFSLVGFIIGIWADGFEKLQLVPLLIVTPLTFLGGSFYSIDMLPPFWQTVTLFNPVVYLISGFSLELLRHRRRQRRHQPRHDHRCSWRYRWRSWRGYSKPDIGSRPSGRRLTIRAGRGLRWIGFQFASRRAGACVVSGNHRVRQAGVSNERNAIRGRLARACSLCCSARRASASAPHQEARWSLSVPFRRRKVDVTIDQYVCGTQKDAGDLLVSPQKS